MRAAVVAVVAATDDELANRIAKVARQRGVPAVRYASESLADVQCSLVGDVFSVEGQVVRGVVFRGDYESRLSASYDEDDRRFADLEVGSVWLAAMHLPSVTAVNRMPAHAWFERGWPTWRRVLHTHGATLAPIRVGTAGRDESAWFPYTSRGPRRTPDAVVHRALAVPIGPTVHRRVACCCGRAVGTAEGRLGRIARKLDAAGISLVELQLSATGDVCNLDPNPQPTDSAVADKIAELVVERFSDRLRRW